MLQRIKGTQDFLDLAYFNFLIAKAKKQFEKYGYIEIATPILEPVELFKRSLGLETDVVTKEMYTINNQAAHIERSRDIEHGNDADLICLRPEATASTMRAFLQAHIEQLPWKVFTYGPMFRHERPQKGRFRQFHQISLEIIGTQSIMQDAQLITMLDRLFSEQLLLDNYALLLNFLGCAQDRVNFKKIVHAFLEKHVNTLCSTCVERKEKNILRVFDCKNQTCQELYTKAPKTTEHLCTQCAHEWDALQTMLQKLSVSFSCVPTLVRGLDYYDKTVFEFVSTGLGAQNAFCGGGRYDGLAEQIGSTTAYPSIGAAIGIERVIALLEGNTTLSLPQPKPLQVIIPMTAAQQSVALLLADHLLAHDICVTVLLENDSMKSMMRKANKLGAQHVLIIGEEEQKNNSVTIKNMITSKEHCVRHTEAFAHITNGQV